MTKVPLVKLLSVYAHFTSMTVHYLFEAELCNRAT